MDNLIGKVMFDDRGRETLIIHYAYSTGKFVLRRDQRVAQSFVACLGREAGGMTCSSDVQAVNCKSCKDTEAYKKQTAEAQSGKQRRENLTIHYAYATDLVVLRRGQKVSVPIVACYGYDSRGVPQSDDPRAVTCEICKFTEAYKRRAVEIRTVDRKWQG